MGNASSGRAVELSGPNRSILTMFGLILALAPFASAESFRFHHDDILGTSMDLEVVAPDQAQAAAVDVMLVP